MLPLNHPESGLTVDVGDAGHHYFQPSQAPLDILIGLLANETNRARAHHLASELGISRSETQRVANELEKARQGARQQVQRSA